MIKASARHHSLSVILRQALRMAHAAGGVCRPSASCLMGMCMRGVMFMAWERKSKMSSMFWECASCCQKNPAIVQNCSCAKQKAKWQQLLEGSVGDVRAFLAVIGVCVIVGSAVPVAFRGED